MNIKELLVRGVEEIIVKKDLEKKLGSGKKLRIKHGVDPTTKDLHIGYAVVYNRLRDFQDLGHKIVFLIGDFTARFGDPTDKEKIRTLRNEKEVRELAGDYINQLGKILDLKKTEIRYNSEWYDKMKADELLMLMSHFTSQRMIERDMFQERIKKGEEIGLHEPVYPVLQAYDSVMLKSDFTVIGSDQTFNELRARDLQRNFSQVPQDVMSMKILIGTDGKMKMSQSLGNYIGITENPAAQFGKIMSIPDNLIIHYFELATRMPMNKIQRLANELKKGLNPKEVKLKLAFEIVKMYHSENEAKKSQREFEKVFSKREVPEDIPCFSIKKKPVKLVEVLLGFGMVSSKSEARRLIEQKAVDVDGTTIFDKEEIVTPYKNMIIRVGKRKWAKII